MILRLVAIAIAVAGTADPALTINRPARQPLTITIVDTPSLALPAAGETRRDAAYRSANEIRRALEELYETIVREQPAETLAPPCRPNEACIVISDGARPRRLDAPSAGLGGVRVHVALSPNVAVSRIVTPLRTHVTARAAVDVELSARGGAGNTTQVDVLDGGISVGRASYTWPSADDDSASARVRVEWAPLGYGQRNVRVVASAMPGEATEIDNVAHTAVEVTQSRYRVFFYEPQPSWGGTFVRRALESDSRFELFTRLQIGRSLSVTSQPLALTEEALTREDIQVVVVSSPQFLGGRDLETLRWLATTRGGSVLLLLDSAPSGQLAELFPLQGTERREAAPVTIGALKATELIALRQPDFATSVLASAGGDPVVVSRALGHGRVIVSGAVDAWRYRAEGDRFAAFWRALVADAALAADEPLLVTLSTNVATPDEEVEAHVELRSVEQIASELEVSARLECSSAGGNSDLPVRLWPTSTRGRFRGSFEAPRVGNCRLRVSLPSATSAVPLLVVPERSEPFRSHDELTPAIAAYGGTAVDAGNESALIRRLQERASSARVATEVRPMRSPWWIVPFAACLGGEWWLRRRRGLL